MINVNPNWTGNIKLSKRGTEMHLSFEGATPALFPFAWNYVFSISIDTQCHAVLRSGPANQWTTVSDVHFNHLFASPSILEYISFKQWPFLFSHFFLPSFKYSLFDVPVDFGVPLHRPILSWNWLSHHSFIPPFTLLDAAPGQSSSARLERDMLWLHVDSRNISFFAYHPRSAECASSIVLPLPHPWIHFDDHVFLDTPEVKTQFRSAYVHIIMLG